MDGLCVTASDDLASRFGIRDLLGLQWHLTLLLGSSIKMSILPSGCGVLAYLCFESLTQS